MVTSEQFKLLIRSLRNIESKLDVLITLQKSVTPKPYLGVEEKKILKLCDKKHTIDDIMKVTGKKKNNINVVLSHLRKKSQIRSVRSKGKIVYERI